MPAVSTAMNVDGSAAASGILGDTIPNTSRVDAPSALMGWAVAERSGAAASFRLRDGSQATSPVLYPLVTLVANESSREHFEAGIEVNNGAIYLQVVSGSIEGNIFWSP